MTDICAIVMLHTHLFNYIVPFIRWSDSFVGAETGVHCDLVLAAQGSTLF